jgi:hypothetical protein
VLSFLLTLFGIGGVLFLLLLLIDPYDSARFPSFGIVGVDDHNPRTANVSRGRDPRFNAAIVANSTGQLLQPARLDAATGLRFMQLATPQTGPREHLAELRWVASHHPSLAALVLVTDELWCSSDPRINLNYPFPFWLYRSDAEYLANVLNWNSIDRAVWRVQLALGQRHPTNPVGYSDYSPMSLHPFWPVPAVDPPITPAEAAAPFPWIKTLAGFVAKLPQEVAFVIVMPPVEISYLPHPGSPAATRLARCKQALASVVAGRPRSAFLDFRNDTPEAHDRNKFFDHIHYKNPIAREIEDRIITVLRPQPSASGLARR